MAMRIPAVPFREMNGRRVLAPASVLATLGVLLTAGLVGVAVGLRLLSFGPIVILVLLIVLGVVELDHLEPAVPASRFQTRGEQRLRRRQRCPGTRRRAFTPALAACALRWRPLKEEP